MKKLRQAVDDLAQITEERLIRVQYAISDSIGWSAVVFGVLFVVFLLVLDTALEDLGRCLAFRRDCY